MPSQGSILLGEVAQHLDSVDIRCNFCPRVGKANVARLLSEHGPNLPIPTLLRLLSADCPGAWLPGSQSPVGAFPRTSGSFRAKKSEAMIVTTRPPRRKRPKLPQPVEIKAPRVIHATPKGRA
jgi:hypothetical protein